MQVDRPTAIALDTEENIYVAQASLNRIAIYNRNGVLLGTISGLAKPISVAVDGEGRIYVGCDDSDSVNVYTPDRNLLLQLGRGSGEFAKPNSIAIDSPGNIYVVDSEADMVKAYSPDGAALFVFGGTGNTNGLFNFPTSIAIDENNAEIIVSDLQTFVKYAYHGSQKGARIQVFAMDGTFRRSFGKFGQGDGLLTKPVGVDVDSEGRIYVADAYQNVVQVFNGTGSFLKTIYDLENPLRTPLDLAISSLTDKLYIPSLNANRVEIHGLALSHVIDVAAGIGGSISPAGPVSASHGDIINFAVTPDANYSIVEVLVDGIPQEFAGGLILTVVDDHRIEAFFELNAFAVTVMAGNHGKISPAGISTVEAGDSLALAITPEPNYHLAELVIDGKSMTDVEGLTGYTFDSVWNDHTIKAVFTIDQFAISAAASPMGSVSIPGSGTVPYGGETTVSILAKPGYRLIDVLVDGASVGPVSSYTFTNVTADHTVTPVYVRIFSLFASATDGGAITPAGETIVTESAGRTFTMAAAEGYKLANVLVDGIPTGPLTTYTFKNISADHTIAAIYEEIVYHRFSVTVEGAGEVTSVPAGIRCPADSVKSGDLAEGTLISLHTVNGAYSVFDGWDGDCSGSSDSCELTIDGPKSVIARFIPNPNVEYFESGDFSRFPWLTGGDGSWQVQDITVYDGAFSMQAQVSPPQLAGKNSKSGAEPAEDTVTFVEVPLNVTTAGNVSFWLAVSSVEGASGLTFMIDDIELGSWSGESGWQEVSFPVTAGWHIFRWEYNGGALAEGTAWLDDIGFPDHEPPTYTLLDLKVNNSDGPVTLNKKETLTISLGFVSGDWLPPEEGEWQVIWSESNKENKLEKKVAYRSEEPRPDSVVHQKVSSLEKLAKGEYTFTFLKFINKDYLLVFDTVQVIVR